MCATLNHRIFAISDGNYGDNKQKELEKAKNEIKAKYYSKLLSSLILIDADVPKKCIPALKSFLDKKIKFQKLQIY